MKAGRIMSGEFATDKSVKEGSAFLVLVSEDASDNTKKTINDACLFHKVKLIECSDMSELGHAVGASADRAVVSVNDNNFAKAIQDIYNALNETEKG